MLNNSNWVYWQPVTTDEIVCQRKCLRVGSWWPVQWSKFVHKVPIKWKLPPVLCWTCTCPTTGGISLSPVFGSKHGSAVVFALPFSKCYLLFQQLLEEKKMFVVYLFQRRWSLYEVVVMWDTSLRSQSNAGACPHDSTGFCLYTQPGSC